MRCYLFIFLLFNGLSIELNAQCPDGPEPFFWHPDQVDSFKLVHPNCDKYSWQFIKENGVYILPRKGNSLKYLVTLIGILGGVLLILKTITTKIRYFH